MRLIDADELKDFFFLETSGTEETIRDLMMQHNLDYANDVNEDEVMDFATELLKNVCNVIDTAPTAYDIDKVVDNLELHSFEFGTDTLPAHYVRLNDAIEIVKAGR